MSKQRTVIFAAALIAALFFVNGATASKEHSTVLSAERTAETINIDGVMDEDSWKGINTLVIPVFDGKIGDVDVEMRALYDDEYVYMFIEWPDKTKSDRILWTYNGTSWLKPNETTEDLFSMYWNIDDSVAGFNIAGCAITCHADRMRTNTPEERLDCWKWHAATDNPDGYVTDGYLDNELVLGDYHPSGELNTRHAHKQDGDPGAYKKSTGADEEEEVVNAIVDESGNVTAPRYYKIGTDYITKKDILAGRAKEFRDPDRFNDGKRIPAGFTLPYYISQRPGGSAGDIEGKGVYRNGTWHLELKRKLITGYDDDVQFDITRTYRFSIAVHDNSRGAANKGYGKGHSISMLARTLEFGGPGSEEITKLALIRDYLTTARVYTKENKHGMAYSEIGNALVIFNDIGDTVANADPQLYMVIKGRFKDSKRSQTTKEIDSLIEGIDDATATLQGKRKPKEATLGIKFIVFWGRIQLYIFILLGLFALYPLYRALKLGKKSELRHMSIFLVIVTIPIVFEGVGRFGIQTGQVFLQNFSFMTNEHATFLWAAMMSVGLYIAGRGFKEMDGTLESLKHHKTKLEHEVEERTTVLKETKEFLDSMIESSPDSIIATDLKGRIISFSRGAEELFGFKEKDVVGTPIIDLYPEELKEEREKIQHDVLEGKTIRNFRTKIYNKDRQPIDISLSISAMRDRYGSIIGTVGISKDITKEVKLEQEIQESYSKLEKALVDLKGVETLKEDILSNVSHELRTPVASIFGVVDLLTGEDADNLTPEQEELIKITEKSATRLSTLIDDLLDISREKTVEPGMEVKKLSIGDIIQKAIDETKIAALENGIEVKVDIQEDMPQILADEEHITRVVMNLLTNAIKFNKEKGKVIISARHKEESIEVSVEDTGIGIPEDEFDKIFERFYQSDASEDRRYLGTGIGLAMVKEIIEDHGGNIWLSSTVGEGSKFTFTIPTFKMFWRTGK